MLGFKNLADFFLFEMTIQDNSAGADPRKSFECPDRMFGLKRED
jgi:hypothetical protein